jgi:hypothetical protein
VIYRDRRPLAPGMLERAIDLVWTSRPAARLAAELAVSLATVEEDYPTRKRARALLAALERIDHAEQH